MIANGDGKLSAKVVFFKNIPTQEPLFTERRKKMTYEEERIKYEDMKVKTKEKKLDERVQRKAVHKEFVKKHKGLFLAMDIFVVLMILVNFGTVVITNALVVKAVPDVKIMEANVVQAEVNDYEYHPEGQSFMNMFMFQSLMWAIILTAYFYNRTNIYTNKELLWTTFIMVAYTYLIYFDFLNDLGFWLGVKIWGI